LKFKPLVVVQLIALPFRKVLDSIGEAAANFCELRTTLSRVI